MSHRAAALLYPIALALAAAMLPAPRAQAASRLRAQPVYRCVGPDGSIMFSGTPCSMDSLARQALPVAASGGDGPALHLCPLDVQELRARVGAAFLAQDVNRLAGLMLWQGYDDRAARARMRSLAAAMQGGLAGIEIDDAAAPPAVAQASGLFAERVPASVSVRSADTGAPQPVQLRVLLEDGATITMGIIRDHGCWWLQP